VDLSQLNPIIHAPVRLAILSLLITVKESDFTHLKKSVGTTDGNLSTHLTRLEEKGYVNIEKRFVGKKPATFCRITEKGRKEFTLYLNALERIIRPPHSG
jgi:DNA-binding transcriptional ArsR family regulator